MLRAASALLLLALAAPACRPPAGADEEYRAAVEKARAARVAELTAEDGWLSLVARHLLAPGENVVGSDPAAAISLDAPGIPLRACSFDLRDDGKVALRAEPKAPVAVNGGPPTTKPLVPEDEGKADVVTVGRVRMTLFRKDGRLLVRARDPESARRRSFRGLAYFPLAPAWRVEATFEPYGTPREVEIPSSRGPAQKAPAPGLARFTAAGLEMTLEPILDGPDDGTLFFVFADATSGVDTYGGGRFLRVPRPKEGGGRIVLDFNLAESPPCALTPFASCPLAIERNTLPVRVEAGEKAPAGH
jgi:uncharacterized protein (DUF1684 family)